MYIKKKTIKLVNYYNLITIFSSDFTSYMLNIKTKESCVYLLGIRNNTIQNTVCYNAMSLNPLKNIRHECLRNTMCVESYFRAVYCYRLQYRPSCTLTKINRLV